MTKKFLFISILLIATSMIAQHDSIKKSSNKRYTDYSNAFIIDAKLIERNTETTENELESDISYLFNTKKSDLNLSYNFNPKKYLDPTNESKHNFMTGPKPLDSDIKVIQYFDGNNVTKPKLKTSQDLGTIESNTTYVRIEYKDFGEVDGDRVRVYLNEKEVDHNVSLKGLFYTMHIKLTQRGYNRIDIESISQGYVGANTAEFIVYDDKGKIIAHKSWFLKNGQIATLGIVRH